VRWLVFAINFNVPTLGLDFFFLSSSVHHHVQEGAVGEGGRGSFSMFSAQKKADEFKAMLPARATVKIGHVKKCSHT
jgi:hypothetical protein